MSIVSEAFIVPPGQGRHLDLGNFEAVVLDIWPVHSAADAK
jgi:hypothetical protein